jgi:anti-sigma factor RsiW
MVTDYLEGALPFELHLAADRHLMACPHCQEYLGQMRRIIEISGQLRDVDLPDDVVDAFTRAFQDFQRGR